ncbi:unnamed protein product [Schistosoma curassoni]|nr:unnamed protein product [Schistosoma curassoni]
MIQSKNKERIQNQLYEVLVSKVKSKLTSRSKQQSINSQEHELNKQNQIEKGLQLISHLLVYVPVVHITSIWP